MRVRVPVPVPVPVHEPVRMSRPPAPKNPQQSPFRELADVLLAGCIEGQGPRPNTEAGIDTHRGHGLQTESIGVRGLRPYTLEEHKTVNKVLFTPEYASIKRSVNEILNLGMGGQLPAGALMRTELERVVPTGFRFYEASAYQHQEFIVTSPVYRGSSLFLEAHGWVWFAMALDAQQKTHLGIEAINEQPFDAETFSVVEFFLEHGASASIQTNEGSALHEAVRRDFSGRMVQLLLDHGANIDSRDASGRKAQTLAEEIGNENAVRMIKRDKWNAVRSFARTRHREHLELQRKDDHLYRPNTLPGGTLDLSKSYRELQERNPRLYKP